MAYDGPKCSGKSKRSGQPCKRPPIRGGTVCATHGGSAPHVKAKAAVRAEISDWGLDNETVDPGEVLLRLVTQSYARARRYAAELERLVDDSPDLQSALVREAYGEFGPVGEYARGLVVLEAQERDRCATFSAKAIAAGLAERQVRMAERVGQQIADVLQAVLASPELGLTAAQRSVVPQLIRGHLTSVG